ncbi:zinc-dependent dehydrogenase [Candidatus Omnitrophota bacterium]
MRVAMYYNNNDVRLEDLPKPRIKSGELLVRVEASGLCGTDVMEWYRIKKAPLVLGHEIAGEVVSAGDGVDRYKAGDRVAASHHVPCGKCHYCQRAHETVCDTLRETKFYPGGFSEFVRLPSINVASGVYRLPDEVSYEEATFIEPLACVLRAQRAAGVRAGDTVLVMGSGISGLLHIKLARANGASRIIATDVVEYRIKAAENSGADAAIPADRDVPGEIKKANGGRLADVVVVCAGAKTANVQALSCVDRGGTILFFASSKEDFDLPVSVNHLFWRNEITLTSSYAGSPQDHLDAMELIRSRKIDVKDMITHRLGLGDALEGFRLVARSGDSIKVIIEPQK